MRDSTQFEVVLLVELCGIIATAFLLQGNAPMWIAIIGAFFVLVIAMSNTWLPTNLRHSFIAPWIESLVLILICLASFKDAGLWALIAIRVCGLVLTISAMGQKWERE